MRTPVTARQVAVTADSLDTTATSAPPTSAKPPGGAEQPSGRVHTCVICGVEFMAKRSARCCSGKCRLALSRTRRVQDVAGRLAKAEAALAEAGAALRELRVLVEARGRMVAP